MKKIMYNDKYSLTDAVLQGRKTMTRRLVGNRMTEDDIRAYLKGYTELANKAAQYKIGEVVAVAQSYKDCGYTKEWVEQHISPNPNAKPTDPFEKKYPGWNNKMFVRADLMPNHTRITDTKIERLQDCSDDDILKEGILESQFGDYWFYGFTPSEGGRLFKTPRTAFAALIDKVSGKGTWESNPWVFAYEYEQQ